MEKDTRDLTLGPQGGRFHNEVEKEPETAAKRQEARNLEPETSHGTWDYCVAIRTLGTAGEKYQTLLNSLVVQTLPPKKILVYIPYGYPAPKETVGVEQIVRCEKGMVAQRSLPFEEVDTEYILFCDDDVYLSRDSVELLFDELRNNSCDCIAADVFRNSEQGFISRLYSFIHNNSIPHFDNSWAIKVLNNGFFSYVNSVPSQNAIRTQSAAFPCFLCKTNAYHAIHYDDERWLDGFRYASQDDQLFFYKMHIMGFKVFMHFKSGIIHLDAKSASRPQLSLKYYIQKKISFIIWYRTIYNLKKIRLKDRIRAICAYSLRFLFNFIFVPAEIIHCKSFKVFIDLFRSQIDGIKYVRSKSYKSVPLYDAYK